MFTTDEPIFLLHFNRGHVDAAAQLWDEEEAQQHEGWGYLRTNQETFLRGCEALFARQPFGEHVPLPSWGEDRP